MWALCVCLCLCLSAHHNDLFHLAPFQPSFSCSHLTHPIVDTSQYTQLLPSQVQRAWRGRLLEGTQGAPPPPANCHAARRQHQRVRGRPPASPGRLVCPSLLQERRRARPLLLEEHRRAKLLLLLVKCHPLRR